jgi:hypothetical protein
MEFAVKKSVLVAIYCFGFLFSVKSTFAYTINLSMLTHAEKDRIVFIAGDSHYIGTAAENRFQLKFIKEHILDYAESIGFPLKVLYEEEAVYGYKTSELKKIFEIDGSLVLFKTAAGPIKKPLRNLLKGSEPIEPEDGAQTTWLGSLVDLICKSNYQHVDFKSVDPRIAVSLWSQPKTLPYMKLFDLPLAPSKEAYTYFSENLETPQGKVFERLHKQIRTGYKKIMDVLKTNDLNLMTFREKINFNLIQENSVPSQVIDDISTLLKEDFTIFSPALDIVTVWELLENSDQAIPFVFAGDAHRVNITESLVELGYTETKIVETVDRDYLDELNSHQLRNLILERPDIQQGLEKGFLFINEIMKKYAGNRDISRANN